MVHGPVQRVVLGPGGHYFVDTYERASNKGIKSLGSGILAGKYVLGFFKKLIWMIDR